MPGPFPAAPPTAVPATCRVHATVTRRGRSDQIGVDVWMPLSGWNGRFQGVGGFGYTTGPELARRPCRRRVFGSGDRRRAQGAVEPDGLFRARLERPLRLGVDPGLLLSRSARPRGGGEGHDSGLLRDGGEARLLERLLDWRSPGAGAGTALRRTSTGFSPQRLQSTFRRSHPQCSGLSSSCSETETSCPSASSPRFSRP